MAGFAWIVLLSMYFLSVTDWPTDVIKHFENVEVIK